MPTQYQSIAIYCMIQCTVWLLKGFDVDICHVIFFVFKTLKSYNCNKYTIIIQNRASSTEINAYICVCSINSIDTNTLICHNPCIDVDRNNIDTVLPSWCAWNNDMSVYSPISKPFCNCG